MADGDCATPLLPRPEEDASGGCNQQCQTGAAASRECIGTSSGGSSFSGGGGGKVGVDANCNCPSASRERAPLHSSLPQVADSQRCAATATTRSASTETNESPEILRPSDAKIAPLQLQPTSAAAASAAKVEVGTANCAHSQKQQRQQATLLSTQPKRQPQQQQTSSPPLLLPQPGQQQQQQLLLLLRSQAPPPPPQQPDGAAREGGGGPAPPPPPPLPLDELLLLSQPSLDGAGPPSRDGTLRTAVAFTTDSSLDTVKSSVPELRRYRASTRPPLQRVDAPSLGSGGGGSHTWTRKFSLPQKLRGRHQSQKARALPKAGKPLEKSISVDANLDDIEGLRQQRASADFGCASASAVAGGLGRDDGRSLQLEFRLRDQLFSFFQASDNKLAMKLFGNKNALLKEKRRQIEANSWIIHPCSNFRLYWDILMLIFLATNLVVLPVSIAFFYDDNGAHWIVFNILCDIMFILDIVINFRTGLISSDSHCDIILDPAVIAKRYVRGWFAVDLVSSLPLDYAFWALNDTTTIDYSAGRALRILRLAKLLQLLRILRISRLVRYIKIWQEFFSIASAIVRILNLICVMVLLSHWSGCIQFFVPALQGWPDDSWISLNKLHDKEWWEQYSQALFKALSHMLCIGYGQYAPQNITDTWLTMLSMLAGASCYAMLVGHTTALIQSFDVSNKLFRSHLQQVNEYMIYRKLPMDIRRRIIDYYEHRYGGKMFNEQEIMSELSDSLKKEIVNHNCQELIRSVPFFVNADSNFVNDVISKLEFEMFQPGDTVIKANSTGHKMYFIQEGLVEVAKANGEVVTRLGDGSYFGEIALLTKTHRRTATVRSISYCNFFSLSDVHFNKILESYPVMRRTLETIAARRLQSLGENPTILTSRESLLEDIQGIYTIITDAAEAHEDALNSKMPGRGGGGGGGGCGADGSVERQTSKTDKSQFLDAVKGFFTKDSDVLLRASSKTLANFELLTGEERPTANVADRSGRGASSGNATPKRSASACDGEPSGGSQWPAGMFLAPPGEPPKRSMSSSDVNIFAGGASGVSGVKVQRAPGAAQRSNHDDRPKSSGGK